MSVQAMTWAFGARGLTPSEKLVLLCLANYATKDLQAWPSQETVAEETELSPRTVWSALKSLEGKEVIRRKRRFRSDGTRTTDVFTINLAAPVFDQARETTRNPCDDHSQPLHEPLATVATLTSFEPPIEPSIGTKTPPTPPQAGGKRGHRLPDDWQPSPQDRDKARAEGLTEPEIDRAAIEFCNYWHSRPGSGGCKLDWSRTWHNWVISDGRRRRGSGSGVASRTARPGGGGQGPADFASLVARRRGYG